MLSAEGAGRGGDMVKASRIVHGKNNRTRGTGHDGDGYLGDGCVFDKVVRLRTDKPGRH
jgi:hypothetical protein